MHFARFICPRINRLASSDSDSAANAQAMAAHYACTFCSGESADRDRRPEQSENENENKS